MFNIVLYGTGSAARKALNNAEVNCKLLAVVGAGAYSDGELFCGAPVKSDTYLRDIDEDFDLVIASQYFDLIYARLLQEEKLTNKYLKNIYVPNLLASKPPYDDLNFPRIENAEWEWLEQQFQDEKSLQLLSYIKRERQAPSYPSDSFVLLDEGKHHVGLEDYWDTVPGSRAHENAVVIDVGAYTGDSMEQIVKNIGGKAKMYYAFEPMKENFEQLKMRSVEGIETFLPKKAALGKEAGTTIFEYNEICPAASSNIRKDSRYAEFGESVEVITIDSLCLSESADYFLKMDIEGSEMAALMGAEAFIRSKRPNLAICVYHKQRDLIEIPQYLKKLVPDYHLYLVGGSHTILIAQ